MIQYHVRHVIQYSPNVSFQFAIQPVRKNRYQEMDVVHVQVEIVHPAIIKGEI